MFIFIWSTTSGDLIFIFASRGERESSFLRFLNCSSSIKGFAKYIYSWRRADWKSMEAGLGWGKSVYVVMLPDIRLIIVYHTSYYHHQERVIANVAVFSSWRQATRSGTRCLAEGDPCSMVLGHPLQCVLACPFFLPSSTSYISWIIQALQFILLYGNF